MFAVFDTFVFQEEKDQKMSSKSGKNQKVILIAEVLVYIAITSTLILIFKYVIWHPIPFCHDVPFNRGFVSGLILNSASANTELCSVSPVIFFARHFQKCNSAPSFKGLLTNHHPKINIPAPLLNAFASISEQSDTPVRSVMPYFYATDCWEHISEFGCAIRAGWPGNPSDRSAARHK